MDAMVTVRREYTDHTHGGGGGGQRDGEELEEEGMRPKRGSSSSRLSLSTSSFSLSRDQAPERATCELWCSERFQAELLGS